MRDNHFRTSFGKYDCTIYSYPSSGGLYVKTNADAVDLDFLNLPRLYPFSRQTSDISKSDQDAEEDAFTRRLRMLGAQYFASKYFYLRDLESHRQIVMPIYGWPSSGGLLVLSFEKGEVMPSDVGRLRFARSMDERCEVMKDLGAIFYEQPGDSGLAALFEEDGVTPRTC